ncbi:MAG: acyl-CoA mutase large subunit family protein [Bacteroidales bacterium]|nr:acyl-CoA mutase large subunit family protein [Bacteroidales bacterium]
MKKEKLFKDFNPVTKEQWDEKIKEDLNGADYEKKLVWNSPEGFKVNPYYTHESLKDKEYLETLPGEYPFVRGNRKTSNAWEIRQDIIVNDIKNANQKALYIIKRGITSLGFIFKPGSLINNQDDISLLLKDIQLDCIQLNFICDGPAPYILKHLDNIIQTKKIDRNKLSGSFDFDPLGHLTVSGNYYSNEESDFHSLMSMIHLACEYLPNFRIIGINGCFFNDAGASVVQELGYSLAIASDYLSRMTDARIDPSVICHSMQFNFGVGSNYFMEIAKIRAARFLFAKLAEAYKVKEEASKKINIHSVTSGWNQTIYDPYTNVLRATTESMAAIIGGTDSLVVRPFNSAFTSETKFSERIARNIQIVLHKEAYLENIVDPSAGSYYIETLTDSIIHEAWKLFLQVEEQGGYLKALKNGIIQSDISIVSQKHRYSVASGREVLLGINRYPNLNESVKDEIVADIAFPSINEEKHEVTPIHRQRGSAEIEKIRLAAEKHREGQPVVFMLTYGNQAMRRARAGFSCNFFACGGYKVIDNPGFSSIEEGVSAAFESKADIIVICSSDEEYPGLVPAIKELVQKRAILVVAGAPDCMEELESKGIANFIHLQSNMVDLLKEYHRMLKIKI